MQIVRTILWVLLFAGLMFFSFFNWKEVEVQIWTNMVLETKVPALVIVSFLLGMIPTWLLHRGTKWRLTRRIKTLEAAARIPQVAPAEPGYGETMDSAEPTPEPAPTSTYSPNTPV
ncbi:MAG: hypothetical protein WBH10_14005 [Allopontixanthobacter sediminis]